MNDREPLRKAGDADVHPTTPFGHGDEPGFARRGSTTSDAIGPPDKDKLVALAVQVPKSLRKAVRAEAERRGISVDEVVAEALRDRSVR